MDCTSGDIALLERLLHGVHVATSHGFDEDAVQTLVDAKGTPRWQIRQSDDCDDVILQLHPSKLAGPKVKLRATRRGLTTSGRDMSAHDRLEHLSRDGFIRLRGQPHIQVAHRVDVHPSVTRHLTCDLIS